jgi:hypothetical protein
MWMFRQNCNYRQAMALLDGRVPPSAPLIKQVQAGNISSTSSSWLQAGLAQQIVAAGSSNAYHTTSFEQKREDRDSAHRWRYI